ncbi:MAG: MiaB/RimO family radical SAM methylthiotransferase [Opitutales bacterium]|nr:MiaB/RimO family radical SAM methylthiotransferase [Opitutales bacterium]
MANTLAVFTLGCRVNQYESRLIEDRARALGFEIAEKDAPADFAVINSCALTVLAEAKTRQCARIFARKNPGGKIAITGCLAQTARDALLKLPNVKWIVGNPLKAQCPQIIKANPDPQEPLVFDAPAKDSGGAALCGNSPLTDRANLKIQDGCDNACSYCIIPRARGKPTSRGFAEIVADAENLVGRGVREIILTGINIAKFSSKDGTLADLADRICAIPELLRLRLGSMEPPAPELDALLERAADPSHKLCPHFHISAQSLSDGVLAAMRRKYRAADFLETLEKIRASSPRIAVGTDIICGHPRESRADFETTRERLLNSGMAYAHVFTFSPRPMTLAATMPQIDPAERKARSDLLRQDAKTLAQNFAEKNSRLPIEVLLENETAPGVYLARTDNYIKTKVEVGARGMKNRLAIVELKRGGAARLARPL